MAHKTKPKTSIPSNCGVDGASAEQNRVPSEKGGKTAPDVLAQAALDPTIRHASLAAAFSGRAFADDQRPTVTDSAVFLATKLAEAENGDKKLASRFLMSQSVSLDAMFTEVSRRAALNMGDYPEAFERYIRLALKSQSECRATLDALVKIHQPREQTVRHVHVNDGGQAIVADQFHNHTGERENGKSINQSDATSAAC